MSKTNKNIEKYFENLNQKYYIIAAMLNDVRTFIIHNYLDIDNIYIKEKIKTNLNLNCLNNKNILINYAYLNFLKEILYLYKNNLSRREEKLMNLIELTLKKTTNLLNEFSQTLTKDVANYSKTIATNLFCKHKINNNNEETFYITGQLYTLKDLIIHYAVNNIDLFKKILKHTYFEFCDSKHNKTICKEKGFAYLIFITGINKNINFKHPKNLLNLDELLQNLNYAEQYSTRFLEKKIF